MILTAQPTCDPRRFTTLPSTEIDPKPADPMTAVNIFGSGNGGLAIEFPRVAGHADYGIDGNQFHIEWNVKAGLDNGCFSRITGPRANRFRILFSISTHGNEKVPCEFAVWEDPGPFSVKQLLQLTHSGFDPSRGLRSLQPGSTMISIRKILSV